MNHQIMNHKLTPFDIPWALSQKDCAVLFWQTARNLCLSNGVLTKQRHFIDIAYHEYKESALWIWPGVQNTHVTVNGTISTQREMAAPLSPKVWFVYLRLTNGYFRDMTKLTCNSAEGKGHISNFVEAMQYSCSVWWSFFVY